MDPAEGPAATPGDAPSPMSLCWAAASRRIQEVLSLQLSLLQNALVEACERELAGAGEQAAALDLARQLAAEKRERALEQEVLRLRGEGAELRRAGAGGYDSGGDPATAALPEQARSAAPRHGGVGGFATMPTRSSALSPSQQPASSPSQQRRPSASSPLLASSPLSQAQPSRIPKPRASLGKRDSSTLEDLDDGRLLGLASTAGGGQRSSSPMRNVGGGACARDSTPRRTGVKPRSHDDSAVGRKRDDGLKTRNMYDKRALRRMNRGVFRDAIQEWRTQHLAGATPATSSGRSFRSLPAPSACQVFVRLRPIFDREQQQGEFEAATIFEEQGEVVVHNCLFQADLVRMFVQHSGFRFPCAFGPEAANETVYEECCAPLVAHALGGHLATLFMFGQTGSGKTFTMNALMELASRDVFAAVAAQGRACSSGGQSPAGNGDACIRLKTFEISGRKCYDLLTKSHTELKLLDSEEGRTNIVGATAQSPRSADEFLKSVRDSLARRATASHGRNDESSRSHYVCVVELPIAGGALVLVDCAGTERRQDTDQHSTERTRETAEINSSLHALKECIRYRSRQQQQAKEHEDDKPNKPVHVPYRGSQLTRVLHESFTRKGGRLTAIGTVSPATVDTEHTLSTLRTLQLLLKASGHSDAPDFEERVDVDPKATLGVKVRKSTTQRDSPTEARPASFPSAPAAAAAATLPG